MLFILITSEIASGIDSYFDIMLRKPMVLVT